MLFNNDSIDVSKLGIEECKGLIALARTRLRQLVAKQPSVWALQKTWRKEIRYRTCIPRMGCRQTMATSLDHYYLWLSASKEWAEFTMECAVKANVCKYTTYQLVEVPKSELPNLGCWPRYIDNYQMNPEVSDEHDPS